MNTFRDFEMPSYLVISQNVKRPVACIDILHDGHKLLAEPTLRLIWVPLHEEHTLPSVDQSLQLGLQVLYRCLGSKRNDHCRVVGVQLDLLCQLCCVDSIDPREQSLGEEMTSVNILTCQRPSRS